jgi:hypothetical protein
MSPGSSKIYSITFIIPLLLMINCPMISISHASSAGAEEKSPSGVSAQKQPPQKRTEPQPKSAAKSFDLAADRLPPGYQGHDIETLYQALRKAFPPKGEFETTEEYHKRLQSKHFDGIYAFRYDDFGGDIWQYDADKQLITLRIPFQREFKLEMTGDYFAGEVMTTNSIKYYRKQKGSYQAQNAFGVQVTVKRIEVTEYGFAVVNSSELTLDPSADRDVTMMGGKDYVVALTATPKDARILKKTLALLFLCQVKPRTGSPAYIIEERTTKRPTIDSPYEGETIDRLVFVELLQIWVYDTKTGEIYAKYDPVQRPAAKE